MFMKDISIWSDSTEICSFPKLKENIKTKVLVIGGGIAGILCAYELKQRNIDVVLVEQDTIGNGTTKNTTAFITAQHELLYQDIEKAYGIKSAKTYLDLNLKAINKYEKLGKKFDIDYKKCSSILFSSKSNEKILKEKEVLDKMGYKTELVDEIPLKNITICKGIKFNNQGQLNPLKLIKELTKDLTIYENTRIEYIKGKKAYSKHNIIEFEKVVIASHYPMINKTGLYFVKLYQRRSYVTAFKFKNIENTYCSIDEDGMYFRSYNGYLIVGGNDRDTKIDCTHCFKEKVKKLFNVTDIEYSWSNQDIMTIDEIPYIGKYDIRHKHWYVITGFNLWGFTWAMASSFIIADMIEGKKEVKLVSPQRNFIKKQLWVNLKTTLTNMVTFRRPRCTHLGVALKYNSIDKTYECPSHGSRFNMEGKTINGPAKKNSNSDKFISR